MRDIRIVQQAGLPALGMTLDWLLTPSGALDERDALATAVIVALGSDRRAEPADILPDPDDDDRRGWWGDLDAQPIWDGWPLGTRLWLMSRAKIVGAGAREGATVARVEQYIREALQPFITRRIASRMTVTAERVGINRIDARVVLYRGPAAAVDLRFAALWED